MTPESKPSGTGRQTFATGAASKSLPPVKKNLFPDVPMARWLTFDRKTASTLRKQLPGEQVFEHGAQSAVEYASGTQQDLVTLLPTGSTGEVAIAVFRQAKPVLVEKPAPAKEIAMDSPPPQKPSAWKVVAPEPATPASETAPASTAAPKPIRNIENELPFVRKQSPSMRAGGILGTRDEVVFDDEPVVKAKRNWWQRFWDEDE
jgi:hypothetical protein